MLLQGKCEFIYTSLEKCICKYMYLCCQEQRDVFVLAELGEQGLELTSARVRAVLQQEKGNVMKYR